MSARENCEVSELESGLKWRFSPRCSCHRVRRQNAFVLGDIFPRKITHCAHLGTPRIDSEVVWAPWERLKVVWDDFWPLGMVKGQYNWFKHDGWESWSLIRMGNVWRRGFVERFSRVKSWFGGQFLVPAADGDGNDGCESGPVEIGCRRWAPLRSINSANGSFKVSVFGWHLEPSASLLFGGENWPPDTLLTALDILEHLQLPWIDSICGLPDAFCCQFLRKNRQKVI